MPVKETYLHQAGMYSDEVGHWGTEKRASFIVITFMPEITAELWNIAVAGNSTMLFL